MQARSWILAASVVAAAGAASAQDICPPGDRDACHLDALRCIARACKDVVATADPRGTTCRAPCYISLNRCLQTHFCQ